MLITDSEVVVTSDDISKLSHQAQKQSNEVNACNKNTLTIIAIIFIIILVVVCVVLLFTVIINMHSKQISTEIENKLSALQCCHLKWEGSHEVCKLNSDNITKQLENKDTVCVNHNKTNTTFLNVTTWSDYLTESSKARFQVTPVIIMRSGIKDNIKYLQSNNYVFRGYLISMRVYFNGYDDAKDTHVSVYLYPMKDPHYDKHLKSRPLRGTFTIELLNHLNDSNHYSINVTFGTNLPSDYTVENSDIAKGWGTSKYISHDKLLQSTDFYEYYKDHTLYFRVSYHDTEHQIAPVILTLSNFSKKMKYKEEWYSSPFFAFNEGYQMCLRADAAGHGDGEETHLSVYLYLMRGPHDDKLYWPLRGIFTIELLNQLSDSDHYKRDLIFTVKTDSYINSRVVEGNRAARGWGFHKFASYYTLLNTNLSYLKDDSLQFKISYQQYDWIVLRHSSSNLLVTFFNWAIKFLAGLFN